jgi:HAD superfamily hydrolase (TIGR01509 family)
LDVDGTLVDSNDAHLRSWAEAIQEAGIRPDREKLRKCIGMGGDQLLPELGIFPENEKYAFIRDRKAEFFRTRFLPGLQLFPGARELVERLHRRGLKLVVATSSSSQDLTAILAQTGLDEWLTDRVSADEVAHTKPQPDLLELALRKAHLVPEDSILLGDSPHDVYAAKRAHLPVIAFTAGGYSAQELAAADAVYEGPAELLERFKESLLAQAAAA